MKRIFLISAAVFTTGLFAATAVTNEWLGAGTGKGTSTDLDDVSNWSLGHVPIQGENARFVMYANAKTYNFTISEDTVFAPSEIYLWNDYRNDSDFYFKAPRTINQIYGAWGGSSGVHHDGRFQFAPSATDTIVFTFPGSRPFYLPGVAVTWRAFHFCPKSVLDFTASEITFGGEQTSCSWPTDIASGGQMEQTGNVADSASLRFGVPKGKITLKPNPSGRASFSAGYGHIQLRTDQEWNCEPTGFITFSFSQGYSGTTPRYLLEPIDVTNRLDNLGKLNVLVEINYAGTTANSGSTTTGQHILGGTYGSFNIRGGTTSLRERYFVQQGDVAIIGRTISSGATTDYGLEMYSGASWGQYWYWVIGAGNTLAVTNSVQLSENNSIGTAVIDARDGTLVIGGDLVILGKGASSASATNASPTTTTGIWANKNSLFRLGGSFITNYRSQRMQRGSGAALEARNQNFALSTVELVGGAAEKTWEVGDQASTHAFARGTFAISNLCVGTSKATSNMRLVNDYLNENPTNRAEGAYINEARYGEKLVTYRLAIAENSILDANTQNLEIGGKLDIAETGTLRVDTGAKIEKGTVVANVVGIGDQSAQWKTVASRVVDTSNPKAIFKAVYDSEANVTHFVCRSPTYIGLTIIIR